MAIQRTRWKPDTCGCIVIYEWDDTTPPSNRPLTPSLFEVKDARHAGTPDSQLWDLITNENSTKNVVANILAVSFAAIPITISYSANGHLVLTVTATEIVKTSIRVALAVVNTGIIIEVV